MTVAQAVLWVAVVLALVAICLWVRDLGVAGDTRGWPVLTALREYRGGGRDFETLSLAARLERAQEDPAFAERLSADLHRQLVSVVNARLALTLTAVGDGDPVRDELLRFAEARPDPAELTTRAGLDSLLTRIERL